MFVMCLFCLFYGVLLTEKAKVLYEATVLKVEMTDECLTTIQSSREKLTQAETDLLASHRRLQLQEIRNQNEEITSFLKSCQGVFLSPKVF